MFNAAKLGTDTEVNFGDKSFLVIDDFQGMRAVLRDILRACGANARSIVTASNGVEAVAILERNKFDVVLCDYNLGAGKNGQQVLEEARHRKLISPACAWVIITAEKTTDIVTGAAENQPDAYLLKPVTESMLRQRLQKVWTKKEAFAEIDAAIGRKDFRKAIQLCEERMAHDKLNAVELLRIRAQLLLDSGDHARARKVLEEALAEREFPWAKVGLAKILHHEQDYAMAKALLESVTMENRTYVEAYDWLARCHEALGEHEEASRVLEQATRISPHSVARQKSLGELSLKLGNLAVAEKAFKKSVSLGEHSIFRTPDAYLGLAKTYSASDNPNEALQVLDSVTKKFNDNSVKVKALTVTGMVFHRSGDAIQARKVARELAQQMERSPRLDESNSALEAAELFLLTGEKEKAINLLQEQIRNDPDNKALINQVHEVFTAANMGDEGANLVEKSRNEAVTRMNEGVLLAREGKLEEAIASLREARRGMPSNVRVIFNLAHVMITRMQRTGPQPSVTSEIRELLLEANRLAPRDARFSQLMGALAAASGA